MHLLLASAVFSSKSGVQCMAGLAEMKLIHCFVLSRIYNCVGLKKQIERLCL